MGKGLGNGYPVSAVAMSEDIVNKLKEKSFIYSQSHQNDPLGCAVASKVVNVIREEKLIERCEEIGRYYAGKLEKLGEDYNSIKEIRSRGLMIAIEFDTYENISVSMIFRDLLDRGYIIAYGSNFLRLDPSLLIKKEDYMCNYLIRTENLSKQFGRIKAVNGVNLKVPEGGVYGFLGPNGAGKSTTIRMLLGLIKPTEGEAFLFERSIKTDRIKILRQVGSMVEAPSYYGHLTAYENLKIICEIRETDEKEIDRVLQIVDLKDSESRKVKDFSMGMKQRLGIAGALLGDPRLLILDEPTLEDIFLTITDDKGWLRKEE